MKNKSLFKTYLKFITVLVCLQLTNQTLMANTKIGFTLHFDFIDNWKQAEQIILVAHQNGAEILNVVPPAQLWKLPASREILDNIFLLTKQLRMQVVLSRIDACPVSADDPKRYNYLYGQILINTGILPTGKPTPDFFNETVGLSSYEKWLQEETEYYSKNYSSQENLVGFSVGLFNEPFVSQRGSLLCFDFTTNSYEIAQYTPSCTKWWQTWLKKKYSNLEEINKQYNTSFSSFSDIPMPKNEVDKIFGKAQSAYWDLITSINDWVVEQYQDCQTIWHKYATRPIPLILQFSGYVPEKLALGRPAFVALDIFSWMQMADALGLSLYTNREYNDWGHASDNAMIHFIYLAVLQKKPIYIMEGGSENNGAVLIPTELDFFANAGRILKPESYIYEFIKAPYYAQFLNYTGYIISHKGKVNKNIQLTIKKALENAKLEDKLSNEIYVFDDPQSLTCNDLEINKQLQAIALKKTIIFVPKESLSLLPESCTLLVIQQNNQLELFKGISAKKIKILSAREWISKLKPINMH
jgi:hypothetical protein